MSYESDHDLLGRIKTELLYPPFLEKLNALCNALAARGAIFVATSGVRTYEEQNALYAKGRTAPGGIVTNARGGQSPHQFYCATDFTKHAGPTYAGKLIPDYNDAHYLILGEVARQVGLEWGGDWSRFKDFPHVQLPVKAHGLTWAMLDVAYRQGGQAAVFELLDKHGPW